MKKRFLSLLCVLALCLGLLPVTALAAAVDAPQTLYVAGQAIIDEGYYTQSEGSWTKSSDTSIPPSEPYFHYTKGGNNTPATLTLSRATIQGGTSTVSVPYGAGIYAQCKNGESVSLTIELIGNNTITGYYGIFMDAQQGDTLGANASLNITGDGSLTVTGTDSHGLFVKGGTGNASLNIEKATVTSNTNNSYAAGVYVMSSTSANTPTLSLTVNGGSLTASGGGNNDGIRFYVGAPEATNATTSLIVTDNAIVDAKNGGISAKQISNPINTDISATGSNGGIVFDGTEGTVYGDVTLSDSLTINQGETLTVPDGSSLNCNNNLTNNGTINVESGGNLEGEPTSGSGTVVNAPSIGTQPASQSVTERGTAEFSVTATGKNLSYQWQQKTSGSEWTNIPNATSSTYAITNTTTDMSGNQYRCVVSNSAGSVTSDAATLTVNDPAPTTYTITADASPAEGGTVTAPNSAASGETVTIIASANPGYRFNGWTFSGNITDADSSSASTTFTMPAGEVTMTAKFEQVYTVTVSSTAGGTATGGGTYAKGDTVTLTATPNSGYRFVGWLESGSTVSNNTNYTFMANSDRSLTAQFDRISSGGGDSDPTYSVSLPSQVTGGSVTVTKRYAEKGETFRFTVTPDEGYELDTLTVTDRSGKKLEVTDEGDGVYSFKMPAGRVEIEVSFREIAVELPFMDVAENAWYADAAAYVYEHGLMAGTSATTFAPDATTSRSMIATILWRMAGSPVVNYAMDYTDVAQGQWYSEAIRWAASEGIVGGYGNGLFGTNDPITREQFAVMLYRFAQEQGYDVSIGENTNILSYTDVADLSEYAISAMQWAVGAGIINGTGDGSTLSPQGQATRAQAAVMLMRFCEEYVTW